MYGSKILMVTGEMLNVLEGLYQQAARQITGMTVKRGAGREWEYLSIVKAT